MSFIYFAGIALKGIGAILEVLLQISLTRFVGLTVYGNYSGLINIADLIFWALYSGIVRCNAFYLSDSKTSYDKIKKKYYLYYVIPTIATMIIIFGIIETMYIIIPVLTFMELIMMDYCSTMMSRHQEIRALRGEYIIGRIILLCGIFLLARLQAITLFRLLLLYFTQYVAVLIYIFLIERREKYTDISEAFSIKKLICYQRADIVMTTTYQVPVVVQYFFSGATAAAAASIVLLVKRLINFISGPTSKICLPAFSRAYKENNQEKIHQEYSNMIKIQMLFLAPASVLLVGFPDKFLSLFDSSLVSYRIAFILCSVSFLAGASFGPSFAVLQMTGHESQDNIIREICFAVASIVFFLLKNNPFAVLYSLSAQVLLEEIIKMCYVCYYLKTLPIKLSKYITLWLLPIVLLFIIYYLKLCNFLIWMVITVSIAFVGEAIILVFLDKSNLQKIKSVLANLF